MREWQQTRFRELVMPDAVYYQTIWAVRDLERMRARVKELEHDERTGNIQSYNALNVNDTNRDYGSIRPTERHAVEKATLEARIEAIDKAIRTVPPVYRNFILENIVMRKSVKTYPNKLWRVWKQRFLYNVAVNLNLM